MTKEACNEYRLALACGKEYRNADLHLNAGAAFRYEENYPEALSHLQLAVKYDPSDVIGSHSRLSSLTHFLSTVAQGVQSTGGTLLILRVFSPANF
ncbi:tetratricopeptide repeat protein [Oesophagostomum dentatum]|uniref:Tetratricopeptide repeat protein n=1 Tax=Oesophagostomum dentatum TaxID=61180 RepID=A0A0B1S7Z2_OESDE|nr:tetratricopeptide repeat protein [Oesophagostomum dentatum]